MAYFFIFMHALLTAHLAPTKDINPVNALLASLLARPVRMDTLATLASMAIFCTQNSLAISASKVQHVPIASILTWQTILVSISVPQAPT
jgi:hypothetical protein